MAYLLAFVLVGIAVFAPSYPIGSLDGFPADHALDFIGAILLIALVFRVDWKEMARRQFALVVVLLGLACAFRCISSWAYGPHGLIASYWSQADDGQLTLVRSPTAHSTTASRTDCNIAFEGITEGLDRHPLWTGFLNDQALGGSPATRLSRPLEVHWHGFLCADHDCELIVDSSAECTLEVGDNHRVVAGISYPITVQARFHNLTEPHIRLATAADHRSVPRGWLTPRPGKGNQSLAILVLGCSWSLVLAAAGLLLRAPGRAYGSLVGKILVVAAALITGMVCWELQIRRDPTFNVLPADDYLIYETEARKLLLRGFFDDPVPFHRSPGMRYYLAAAHYLFGESGYGVVLFQQVLRGLTALAALAMWRLMGRLFWLGWVMAFVIATHPGLTQQSLRYWPESVATFLFAALALAILKVEARKKRLGPCVETGFWSGLLALIRSNGVGMVPVVGALVAMRGTSRSRIVGFLLPALVLLALVPLRNYLVAGKWEPLSTEGPINLVVGNNIPRDTDISKLLPKDPTRSEVLRAGMEHLWDFEHNPAANFDPFPDNAGMQPALARVWFTYLEQHPIHFLMQLLTKTRQWFFPGLHGMTICSCLAMAAICSSKKGTQKSMTGLLACLVIAYAIPCIISHFEGRHCKVVLPEMIVLAGAGMEAFWLSRPRWQRIFFLPAGFVKLTDGRRGQQVPAINCR
jgi:4-amino-4-deoxy-L-arabinose transferase-like glycosyltransferase